MAGVTFIFTWETTMPPSVLTRQATVWIEFTVAVLIAVVVAMVLVALRGRSAVTPPEPLAVSQRMFTESVVQASEERPVLVQFHAPWCGPCQVLAPILRDVVAAHRARVVLVTINTDEHPALAQAHGVETIPDVRLWYRGTMVASFGGSRSREQVETWLTNVTKTAFDPGDAVTTVRP